MFALLQVSSLTEWTVEDTRGAIDRHERGDLYSSSRLIDWMGRDARISGDLATRVRALSSRGGLPFTVDPSEEAEAARAKEIADQVRRVWWSVLPEETTAQILADTVMAGIAVGRLEWDGPRRDQLRVVPLPTHGLRLNVDEGRWYYQTRDELLPITPGDGTWFLHAPYGPRSFMRGAVRALGLPALMRTFTERDWARHIEKFGLGILGVKEPSDASDDVEGVGVAGFYEQFQNLGSEAVLRMPQSATPGIGWDVRWLEATATNPELFRAHLARLDSDVSMVLLGRDSETVDKSLGGDGEAARAQVRVEYLQSDAEPLTTFLRDQIWKPWGRHLIADWADELAPWGRWNTRPQADLARRATTLSTFGDALSKLTGQGVDPTPLFEEFQLAKLAGTKPQDPTPLFQYHFEYGVVTKNEARERLGLPAIDGGDEPPKPIVQPAAAAPPPAEVDVDLSDLETEEEAA